MQHVEIRIAGHVDKDWSDWLGGLIVTHAAEGYSVLSGELPDQSALYGLLNRLSGLGVTLVSVDTPGCQASDSALSS